MCPAGIDPVAARRGRRLGALVALAAACFDPRVSDGHFACPDPGRTADCPAGMTCCADRRCRTDCRGRPGVGLPDGAAADAAVPCATDADCDDRIACTEDRCDADGRCRHAGCERLSCGDRAYLLCACQVTFDEARRTCAALGGCLVTIEDASENDCLWDLLAPRVQRFDDAPWLGWRQASDGVEPDGGWTWQCGASDFRRWSEVQPDDNGASQDCAVMLMSDSQWGAGGTWDDEGCTAHRWPLCEL